VSRIYAGGTPDKENVDYWTDGSIPWLNSGSVNDWSINSPSNLITEEALAQSAARWVPPQSVVVGLAGQGKTKGTSARLEFRTTTNQSMAAIVPDRSIEYRYLHYWLTSNYQSIRNLAGGDKRDGLNLQHIGGISIPIPPISEQRAIADYLDRETARIDTLIEKQQELIETLHERRRALMHSALTQGLDPGVGRRSAGAEWLGEIPVHWNASQIKWLSAVKRGASPRPIEDPKYFDDEGIWSWVRISDVTLSKGHLLETEQTLSDLGSSLSVKLDPGSLFVSVAASVGKPCITEIPACIHDGFVYFPDLKLPSMWLFRMFEAGECFKGLGKLGTQLNLNTDTIGSITIPVPPRREMHQILDFVETRTKSIDLLISRTEQFITLTKERRSALITAAVTGQIDVREMADG
jgi:type I restriction enzyme S subunit